MTAAKQQADVSLILTSYNQKRYLEQAIDSVLNQTLLPAQLIVVDDGSSDGSRDLIQSYEDTRPDLIQPVLLEKNHGLPRPLNVGLKHASGRYITLLAGDDRLLPAFIENMYRAIRNHDERLVSANFYHIDGRGNRLEPWIGPDDDPPEGNIFYGCLMRRQNRFLFRNWMVARDTLDVVGPFDEDLSYGEDWEMKLRLTKECRARFLREPLLEYRVHPDNLTARVSDLKHHRTIKRVISKHWPKVRDLPRPKRRAFKQKYDLWLQKHLYRYEVENEDVVRATVRYVLYWMRTGSPPRPFRDHVRASLPAWIFNPILRTKHALEGLLTADRQDYTRADYK